MIKYVLVFIAAVLVTLGIYTYSNQANEKSIQKPSISTQKEEPKETKQISLPVVKDTKTVLKKAVLTSPKVVSSKSTPEEMKNEENIGKGLTIESIENADVSDEEKAVMRMDMAYEHSLNSEPSEPLSYEELRDMIEKDVKNGIPSTN